MTRNFHLSSIIIGILLIFIFIFTFLLSPIWFHEKIRKISFVEKNIQEYYIKSLINNGDLNIINQVPDELNWLATKTYNHPDIREYGYFIIAFPFYILAENLGENYFSAQIASNFMALIFALFLTYKVFCYYYSKRNVISILALVFIASSISYYSLINPTSLEIYIFFFSSYIIYLLHLNYNKFISNFSLLSVGILLGLAASIKVHGALFTVFVFLFLFFTHSIKETFIKICYILAGLLPILCLVASTRYLQWGFLQNPYSLFLKYTINYFPNTWNMQNFFGSNGMLTTAPIYLLSFFGLCVNTQLKRPLNFLNGLKWSTLVFFIFIFLLIAKRPLQDELFGSRQLSCYTGLFCFLLLELWSSIKYRARILFLITSFLSFLVYICKALVEILYSLDLLFVSSMFNLSFYKKIISGLYRFKNNNLYLEVPDLLVVSKWTFILFIIILFGWYIFSRFRKYSVFYPIFVFSLIFLTSHIFNFINNSKNSKKLINDGFFSTRVIGSGMNIYIYDDLLSVKEKLSNPNYVSESFYNYIKTKNVNQQNQLDLMYNQFFMNVASEIQSDPIHFKDDLLAGKIRPSHWSLH